MKKRVIHLGNPDVTRCGMFTEILDTQVTSGTREHVLVTTTDRSEVTCKRCKRCIVSEGGEGSAKIDQLGLGYMQGRGAS